MRSDLKMFFDSLNEIENRNSGGCLLMCLCFYRWLKKNNYDTSSFQIKQYDYFDKEKINHNISWLNSKTGYPESSYHYTWIYDGEEYDSNGSYKPNEDLAFVILDGLNTKVTDITDYFCVKALNNADWNFSFDRKKSIPLIEKNLGINLSDIDR